MADLNDVLLAVGRLQEGVDRLREDFTEEKQSAAASRATVHRRLDEQASDIAEVKTDIGIHAMITAQAREEVKSLGGTIAQHKSEVQPSIEEWKRMKTLGIGLAGLLALGGLSFGALLTWAGEATAETIRRILRIG